jgi:hypothetical protein
LIRGQYEGSCGINQRLEARGHKSSKPKRQKSPFRLARLMLVASERAASAFLVQLRGLEAHVISQSVQEGKKRLLGRFALCHPPLSKAPPLFIVQLRRLEARGHKSSKPKRQKSPFRLARLMLVASERAAFAFLVQLRGLEAHLISQSVQEGKKRLHGRFVLCHPPLSKAPPLFIVQLRRLEARGHKSSKPKRQKSPFRLARLMLVASERAASAFLLYLSIK